MRSKWRLDGVRWNLGKVTIPHFGAATPITSITTDQVQKMVLARKRSGKKSKTLWHDVTNLRALLNYAIEKGLLARNPVDALDTTIIGNTKPKKSPLNLRAVDRAAASIENASDRAYFDFLRFTGLRKDEANRLRWDDINFDEGWFHCRGTKTDDSDDYLPLAPILVESLKKHKHNQHVGIRLRRAIGSDPRQKNLLPPPHVRADPKTDGHQAEAEGYAGLLRQHGQYRRSANSHGAHETHELNHDNQVHAGKQESMAKAVSTLGQKILGENLGENQNALRGQKSAENSNSRVSHRSGKSGLRRGNIERKIGGGGQIRTVDAADMSRVL